MWGVGAMRVIVAIEVWLCCFCGSWILFAESIERVLSLFGRKAIEGFEYPISETSLYGLIVHSIGRSVMLCVVVYLLVLVVGVRYLLGRSRRLFFARRWIPR